MSKETLELALDLATMHHSDYGYAELRSKVRQFAKEALAALPAPVQKSAFSDAWTDLTAYILQDDLHNRLTPRVMDIAYSAFMIGRSSKNKDDGGPCDWFNDTKPMMIEQLAKIRKDLAEQPAPVTDTELINRGCHYQTELTQPAPVQGWTDKKQTTLNEWFFSLPEQKQMFLIEDKWALAGAAFDAGMLAAAQQQEPVAGIDPKYLMTHISELVLKLPHGIKENT